MDAKLAAPKPSYFRSAAFFTHVLALLVYVTMWHALRTFIVPADSHVVTWKSFGLHPFLMTLVTLPAAHCAPRAAPSACSLAHAWRASAERV